MDTSAMGPWTNFYVIVGSAAAALTGLQFVVIALVTDSREHPASPETINAFGTPTVVHFSTALLASAIMTAPWGSLAQLAVAIGIWGLGGMVYGSIVARRAVHQTTYQPVFEDWIWHVILPLAAYVAAAIAAMSLGRHPESALFVVGAASLLLLFIGIHNAWDTVTYVTVVRAAQDRPPSPRQSGSR